MRKLILLFLCTLGTVCVLAQRERGLYLGGRGGYFYFEIDKNRFRLTDSTIGSVKFDRLMAEGGVNWISPDLIELNSDARFYDAVYENSFSEQVRDSTIGKDSLLVRLVYPCKMIDLHVECFVEFENGSRKMFVVGSDSIVARLGGQIPKNVLFVFWMRDVCGQEMTGQYLGLVEYDSPYYTIRSGANSITVHIPDLTEGYFERYYFKGEYARVLNNKLIWRGETYKRVKE